MFLLTARMSDPTYGVIPIFRHDVVFYTISNYSPLCSSDKHMLWS